jgi:1-acyl-sn-glycerol-3-phosphate acyltransferase
MYLLNPCAEVIKIRERKGFIRIAVETGVPLLPVYHYGNSQMLVYGPRCLEDLSRRMRMSLGIIFGRWGLPLPFKVKLHMVVGDLIPVDPVPRHHPDFEAAVARVQRQYMAALLELYNAHRAGYGWADRPLVMV